MISLVHQTLSFPSTDIGLCVAVSNLGPKSRSRRTQQLPPSMAVVCCLLATKVESHPASNSSRNVSILCYWILRLMAYHHFSLGKYCEFPFQTANSASARVRDSVVALSIYVLTILTAWMVLLVKAHDKWLALILTTLRSLVLCLTLLFLVEENTFSPPL